MLVAGSDDLCVGFGEGGGVAACPRLFAGVDDVSVILPNKVVGVAGLCVAWLFFDICQSSRLLAELELMKFILRLAKVLLVPVDCPLSLSLPPLFGEEVL